MRRIVVLGGTGYFGGKVIERLRAEGIEAIAASRRVGAGLRIDAEDPASLRGSLRRGDLVIDAAGPFQDRTAALVEAALELGCDVIDISDSLDHAERLIALKERIDASGIRVLNSCSGISAVTAALVRASGMAEPARASGFLAPSARFTARSGVARSLLGSIGRPVRVFRAGRLEPLPGWSRSRTLELPPPLGRLRGRLFESADSLLLPRIWPSLRTVDFHVHLNVRGLAPALALAARSRPARRLVELLEPAGLALARLLGSRKSCLACEVEARGGDTARLALVASERGFEIPIAPAVLAARAVTEDSFEGRGLVPVDRQVDPERLLAHLRGLGITWIHEGRRA